MENKSKTGQILWQDLTVPDAGNVSDFYASVVGWAKSPVNMGGYDDYEMKEPIDGNTVAGICHAQGPNTNLPPQWLIYIQVQDLDASLKKCEESGGKIIGEKRKMGDNYFCLIQDPAGAHVMLCS